MRTTVASNLFPRVNSKNEVQAMIIKPLRCLEIAQYRQHIGISETHALQQTAFEVGINHA